MKKLVKNKDVILDGSKPRYLVEQEAFARLEFFENIFIKYVKILGEGENAAIVFKGISAKKNKEDFEKLRKLLK